MRFVRGRAKKLIVAFHFQFANGAAWKCDDCRRSGLEAKRRCGWLAEKPSASGAIVWARGRVSCETCPVSYVTAESQSLLEEFQAWRLFGCGDFHKMRARAVDAILILENELRTEIRNAQE